MPELFHHITVGFNSTIECLQSLARRASFVTPVSGAEENANPTKKVAAVFVCTSTLPALLTSSMPTLVAAASVRHPSDLPIRLVSLPLGAEKRLAEALSQPRVGFVGLHQDAPGGKTLIDMAMDKTSPVHVPWLKSDVQVEHMPVNIKTT